MSKETDEQPTEESTEEPVTLAPGLAMALAPPEEQETDTRRRRGPDPLAALRAWKPRTRLGRASTGTAAAVQAASMKPRSSFGATAESRPRGSPSP